MANTYTKTTYLTAIQIVCGCGANYSQTIKQENLSKVAIEAKRKEVEKWLIEKAGWVIPAGGGIICGRCRHCLLECKN